MIREKWNKDEGGIVSDELKEKHANLMNYSIRKCKAVLLLPETTVCCCTMKRSLQCKVLFISRGPSSKEL